MTLVAKVPGGVPGANYQLVSTNNDSLPVILEEEGGGPSGPITPLIGTLVVNQNPTGPAGPDGSYSGDLAYPNVADVVAAAPAFDVMLLLSPGNYSGEPTVAWVDKALSFTGQTAEPADTQLPDLAPTSTGAAVELHLQGVRVNVDADFVASGALRVHAFHADVGVSGAPDNVEVTCTACHLTQPIDAASVVLRNCTFGGSFAVTGSVSIDAQSWETAVQTVGPSVFPATTTILGTLTGQGSATGVAVADDGTPVDVITLDHPGTPVAGFTSLMQAGVIVVPDNPVETPTGTVTLTDPDSGSLTIAWGPIPAADSVFVPLQRFGTGSGNWVVSVTVDVGTGDCTVDATLLLVKS